MMKALVELVTKEAFPPMVTVGAGTNTGWRGSGMTGTGLTGPGFNMGEVTTEASTVTVTDACPL
jgi:hypothetical protein